MVIGNGMIARRFAAYTADDDHVIFASGVSDSGTTAAEVFAREETLLKKTIQLNPEKRLVYFSTCGVYDNALKDSPYILHKLLMEKIIRQHCSYHCIFRVSNPIGITSNTHTILNYLYNCIRNQVHFELWDKAYRNLIDLDDMYVLCRHLLYHTALDMQTVNIANDTNYSVKQIVRHIEQHTGKLARYTLIEKESVPEIDTSETESLFRMYKHMFPKDYLPFLLQKYFPESLFT